MSEDFPLRLPTESTRGRSGQEANTRLVNGYTETLGTDQDGKSRYTVYARPGLMRFGTSSFPVTAIGMVLLSDTALVAVLGTQIVSFDTSGNATVLNTLAASGNLTMAINEAATPEVAMVDDGGTFTRMVSGALSNPTTSFAAPNSVTFLRGKFCFTTAGGLIFHSAINNGNSYNAGSFDFANSDPNALVRGIADAGFWYIFGTRTLEIWQDVGAFPMAFQPLQQYIPMGLLAKYSLTKGGTNGLLWVDHRGVVRYGRDGGAQRISTHTVERAIETLPDADRPNLNGTYFVSQGHEFYALSAPVDTNTGAPGFTWVYDIGNQRWYEWNSFGLGRWIGQNAILFNQHWVMSDYRNGLLYQTNDGEYDDAGTEFILELWCPHMHNFRGGIFADSLDIDIASGVGLVGTGTSDDTSPMIAVSFSDDGGETFKYERSASIGQAGQYGQLVRLNQWGRINQKGRIWRIRASSRVLRSVIQANVRGRRCA